MQSERQQLLHQIHAYLGRPHPTVGEQLLDRLAFALMGLVALIDRRVWSKERERDHLVFARLRPEMDIWDGVVFGRGLVRLWVVNGYRHDGWKAARYV